jgi:deoxyribodipyrimidine photo-lyase
LRIDDNAGLFHALKENQNVLPLFIFDTEILNKLEDTDDARVTFIHQNLIDLKTQLEKSGTSLAIIHGNPIEIFKMINPKAVYANHDYEPYARKRDTAVGKILAAKNILFKTFKDQVIFERDDVLKDDRSPYTVFTPYCKKWKAKLTEDYIKNYPTEKHLTNFKKTEKLQTLSLDDIGFESNDAVFPERIIRKSIIEKYHEQRNFPAVKGTTKLSVHLRFGTVSIRKLVQIALKQNETWLNELIWREFYHMIVWHFPSVESAFKPAYDRIEWQNNPEEFKAWCEGNTGYPIVDAGMRELNATGFMHNRVRMITASFLTKHLLIDWRWGEAYFAKKLLDFDLAANNGGWQWAAGCGCDAAPYFRIFNPALQTKKFDPQLSYIRQWVPELNTPVYPPPIVDHAFARTRVLKVYKQALQAQ